MTGPAPAGRRPADRTAGPPRLPSLTGLRAVAALGVFGYHVGGLLPTWPVVRALAAGGQSGVSFFFVLSGFVLTWSAPVPPLRARLFWRRRAARIVPAHLVTWAIGIPVTALTFGVAPGVGALIGSVTLTQAWFDDKSVFFGANGVAWSLSCEALFYLLFPLLLPLVRSLPVTALRIAAAGCLVALAGVQVSGMALAGGSVADPASTAFWLVSVLPAARLPEFVLGMVAAAALARGQLRAIRLRWAVVGAAGAVLVAGSFPSAVVAGWLTALPFALLLCAAAQADLAGTSRVLGGRWCVLAGSWSFAFYLSHQLVIRAVAPCWTSPSIPVLPAAMDLLLAGLAGWLVHHLVEAPAERRWRAPRATRQAASPAAVRAGS